MSAEISDIKDIVRYACETTQQGNPVLCRDSAGVWWLNVAGAAAAANLSQAVTRTRVARYLQHYDLRPQQGRGTPLDDAALRSWAARAGVDVDALPAAPARPRPKSASVLAAERALRAESERALSGDETAWTVDTRGALRFRTRLAAEHAADESVERVGMGIRTMGLWADVARSPNEWAAIGRPVDATALFRWFADQMGTAAVEAFARALGELPRVSWRKPRVDKSLRAQRDLLQGLRDACSEPTVRAALDKDLARIDQRIEAGP